MSLYDYIRMEMVDQANTLWEHGDFLMHRHEAPYDVVLYALFSFYVEAWIDNSIPKIERLRSFSSTNQLEPYLNQLTINE